MGTGPALLQTKGKTVLKKKYFLFLPNECEDEMWARLDKRIESRVQEKDMSSLAP